MYELIDFSKKTGLSNHTFCAECPDIVIGNIDKLHLTLYLVQYIQLMRKVTKKSQVFEPFVIVQKQPLNPFYEGFDLCSQLKNRFKTVSQLNQCISVT